MNTSKTMNWLAAGVIGMAIIMASGVAVAEFTATAKDVAKWRRAAEKGEAWAQNNLGVAYYLGKGVAVDMPEAVRWWRTAAERGVAAAQFMLGIAYASGTGVITDEREAYIWFSIAKANGNEMAADELRVAEKKLSPSEIHSARQEAVRRLGCKAPTSPFQRIRCWSVDVFGW